MAIDKTDPFPNLGRSGFSRRIGDMEKDDGISPAQATQQNPEIKRERARAGMREKFGSKALDAVSEEVATDRDSGQEPQSVSELASPAAPRRAGRPVAPKPWLEAGVSRMTWYRRKKKDESK